MGARLPTFALQRDSVFEARARPFAEFELFQSDVCVLHLKYVAHADLEGRGGTSFRSQFNAETWELQFFQHGWLERESYRVLRNGSLILSTEVLRAWRWANVTFCDGAVWQIRSRFGSTARDGEGRQILHSSPRPGLIMGRSVLRIDAISEPQKIIPMLIVFLHLTTHHKN
jgi:hypothetical protein